MSLLRPSLRAAQAATLPARAFSTSLARRDVDPNKDRPPPRWSTKHVAPGDVVAHKAVGPDTVYDSAPEIAIEVTSDAPAELRHRAVRIFKPTKNTMQSAKGKTKVWRIDFDVLQGAGRWNNPLMGWASSADYMQGSSLAFRTREDAMNFADRQGWNYWVQEPKQARIPPKNYADNYLHIPGNLRICHTK